MRKPTVDRNEVLTRHRDGMTPDDLAHQYGISRSYVYKLLCGSRGAGPNRQPRPQLHSAADWFLMRPAA